MAGGPLHRAVLDITTAEADVARLHPWLDDALADLELSRATRDAMHLALEEVVVNVATHAYGAGATGAISVRLFQQDRQLSLLVEDAGLPFDPVTAAPPEPPARLIDAEPGGLGLVLIRHYCHDLRYERADGRNRLTLGFPQA